MRILFIGGTGVISSACAAAAVAAGHTLRLMTRTQGGPRPWTAGAEWLQGDIRDRESADRALRGAEYDVVVDFVAFTPADVAADIERFAGRTGHYVFIGTTSSYQKPAARLPITESTPLKNPHFAYSREKIACEELLAHAHRDQDFPATVVRPSFTCDDTSFPVLDGWTIVSRMRRGAPVVVHGDGSALGTVTHAEDFARVFTKLLGRPQAIGESYHITSDEVSSWLEVLNSIARAAGAAHPRYVFVPSVKIAEADPRWGETLLGDKTHSAFFDNSKVAAATGEGPPFIPYHVMARRAVAWHDANPGARTVDPARDRLIDALAAQWS